MTKKGPARNKPKTKTKTKSTLKLKSKPKPKPTRKMEKENHGEKQKKKPPAPTKSCTKYPSWVFVSADTADLDFLRNRYGGVLPDIKGRKRKYPDQSDTEGWRRLLARALTFENKVRYCLSKGLKPPDEKEKSKFMYLLHHGYPEEKKKRAKRNRDRRLHGLKKGDALVVHHTDKENMTSKSTVVLTHCQHQEEHGRECSKAEKKKEREALKEAERAEAITQKTLTNLSKKVEKTGRTSCASKAKPKPKPTTTAKTRENKTKTKTKSKPKGK